MIDFGNNYTKIILAIVAIFAIGFTIRFVFKNKSRNRDSNNVNVQDTKIGGDFIGRDKGKS
jgi:hypothetical protein